MSISFNLSALDYLRESFLQQVDYWIGRLNQNIRDRQALAIAKFYGKQLEMINEEEKKLKTEHNINHGEGLNLSFQEENYGNIQLQKRECRRSQGEL